MRDYKEINKMIEMAQDLKERWEEHAANTPVENKKEFAEAVRNYNAMKGVIKSLQWVLNYPDVETPLW